MKAAAQIINQVTKSQNYKNLMESKQIQEQAVRDVIREYFPKIGLAQKVNIANFLNDEQLFDKLQRILEAHQQIFSRIQSIEQQISIKSRVNAQDTSIGSGKKVTRAALARRHEKNQQQIRKDQIFVRLTPKTQSCIQFMLCNRNFPRMQCKLSCNQHLEYLVNYLTNKWIRGKVGYKIVLYPDNNFLKSIPFSEKEKSLKQPLNNYLMFTDIMACCGVHQNGILNLSYEIVEIKKLSKQIEVHSIPESVNAQGEQSQPLNNSHSKPVSPIKKQKNKVPLSNFPISSTPPKQKNSKTQQKGEAMQTKINTPLKINYKDDYLKEASIFNRNSNIFNNNEESIFGSLGFNFNFGATPGKGNQHLLSINSINYLDQTFHKMSQMKKEQNQKQNPSPSPVKIDILNQKKEQKFYFQNQSNKFEVQEKKIKKQNFQENNQISIKKQQVPQDLKLGTLMSLLQQIQKQKNQNQNQNQLLSQQQSHNNNSNKIKDVKLVSIVKKRNNI